MTFCIIFRLFMCFVQAQEKIPSDEAYMCGYTMGKRSLVHLKLVTIVMAIFFCNVSMQVLLLWFKV